MSGNDLGKASAEERLATFLLSLAQRFKARLDHVPTVMRIHEHCLTLPAFAASVPAKQPDAE